jgi:predicted branched-subunit amino acid permease
MTSGQRSASAVRDGIRDAAPVVVAYVPFGLALGATLATTPLSPLIAWSSSPLLFGGAAQLVSVQLLGAGAFLLLLLPMLTTRAARAAAVTGGAVAAAASGLPLGLGLLVGAAAGIAIGAHVGGRRG